MLFKILPLLAFATVIASCAATSSDMADLTGMPVTLEAVELASAEPVATPAQDPSLPEGARMLVKGEDPTAIGGDPDELVCRKSGDTGSRITKKQICMTRAEWRAMQDLARKGMNEFKDDKGGLGVMTR